jgi:flagellar motor switch protein FliG
MVRRRSLSDLVVFEDLAELDGSDLRAVLGQVSDDQALDALSGVPSALRQRLLAKLPAAVAARFDTKISARGPVSVEAVRASQKAIIDALCRLSRGGQVAFDDPADMVA